MSTQEVTEYMKSRRDKYTVSLQRCKQKPNCPDEEIKSLLRKLEVCDVIIESLESRRGN